MVCRIEVLFCIVGLCCKVLRYYSGRVRCVAVCVAMFVAVCVAVIEGVEAVLP